MIFAMTQQLRLSTVVGVASAALFGGSLVMMPDQQQAEPSSTGSEDTLSSTSETTTSTTRGTTSTAASATSTSGGPAIVIPAGASDDERASYVALASLAVKGRAPKTGYDRDLFGQEWSDDVTVEAGHNGCDTRNDILRRDLTDIVIKAGSSGCVALNGTLADPYTGSLITFVRGSGTSTAVQIDHVVSLSDAWQKGAQQWDPATRQNFANDPRNLLAVDGPTNLQKGDGDAATWLPPNTSFRCTLITMQINVKAEYGLWVTQAERDAMERVLDDCDGTSLPGPVPGMMQDREETTEAPPPPPPPAPTYVPPAPTYDPPYVPPADPPSGGAYYKNCAAARAAGAAPLYAGEPGYRSAMDGDGDGVACE